MVRDEVLTLLNHATTNNPSMFFGGQELFHCDHFSLNYHLLLQNLIHSTQQIEQIHNSFNTPESESEKINQVDLLWASAQDTSNPSASFPNLGKFLLSLFCDYK